MIPLTYRLRGEVAIEERVDHAIVVSSVPLAVVRVRQRAAEILALSDGSRNISRIARELNAPETTVLTLSEYFNRKSVLETVQPGNDDYFPSVTVIIPVKDREREIGECLTSVLGQEYPSDRVDVIVVDDGSTDGTAAVASSYTCTVISLGSNRGQSHCRNIAAAHAKGELLAFLDSDCVASAGWLAELVVFFQWDRVGAVGGRVDGYYDESALDRYEQACSSLSMGKHLARGTQDDSNIYVPTCNLLVRKGVYEEVGGIDDSLFVGEDVDLCFRLRESGRDVLYVPAGSVAHKHRNGLLSMLKRRAQYGTSEATLYRLHPAKRKAFGIRLLPAVSFLALCLAFFMLTPLPVAIPVVSLIAEMMAKKRKISRFDISVPVSRVLFSVLRAYLSSFYFLAFHIVRYYLLLVLLLGFVTPRLWLIAALLVAVSSVVDYSTKRPALDYPRFLFFYTGEHIFYQAGVFLGCLREKRFGSYVPRFRKGKVTSG